MLKGIHILSTAPSRARGHSYHPSCLEVSSMVLSALLWRKNCGAIKLYTDSVLYDFLLGNGLTDIWDGGIDTNILETIPPSINQNVFWAAAKLFALRDAEAPVAMVDGDLFFWRDVCQDIDLECVTVLHREDFFECYVPKDLLGIPSGYNYDERWDWKQYPYNTAFAYFPQNEFKNTYTEEAIRFMTGNLGEDAKPSSQMVFAEQRILPMCAKCHNIHIKTLINDPFDDTNTLFTHLWGAKGRARKNKKDMNQLISAIKAKINELDCVIYERVNIIFNDTL